MKKKLTVNRTDITLHETESEIVQFIHTVGPDTIFRGARVVKRTERAQGLIP